MKIVHYPWRVACALTTGTENLPVPDAGYVSPEVGAFLVSDDGSVIREVPGPSVRAGAAQERYEIPQGCVSAEKKLIYPRRVHQYQSCDPESEVRKLHFALTDFFIHMSDLLYQYREKSGERLADISITESMTGFDDASERHYAGMTEYLGDERDFAPESLIVRIARETPPAIRNIYENPRVVLRREHRQVPLDRMQEVDVHALQDYARRPGRTSAMKAGHRQRLLAVVREETADTYENRVVKAFVGMAAKAARQYVEEMCSRCLYRTACSSKERLRLGTCPSERVRTVYSFETFCREMACSARFREVLTFSEPKTMPNYVLQQNPRYLNIWRFYQQLLRQEDVEADVWKWRRRTWADAMRLFMMWYWNEHIRQMRGFALQTSRKPFMIRPKNRDGTWLCSDPFEDAAVFESARGPVTLYLLNADGFKGWVENDSLQKLNADFYWIATTAAEAQIVRIMPVWCICPDKAWEGEIRTKEEMACREIRDLLARVQGQCCDGCVDLSRSIVFFPSTRMRVTEIGKNRFYEVNLFDPANGESFVDTMGKWIEELMAL